MRKAYSPTKQFTRWWDIPSAAMIFIVVLTAGIQLTITRWTPDLHYALNMGMVGVLLGLAMGKSMFKRRVITWLSIEYLLVLLPRQLIAGLDEDIELSERLYSIGNRLFISIGEFVTGRPVEDYILFLTFLCIVYWLVGLTAGYYFVRHANFLTAVLPAGCVMIIIHIYDRFSVEHLWLMALYLFICLLLLGRHFYLYNRLSWAQHHVHLSTETVHDLSTGLIVGAIAITLLAWSLPQVVPYARSIANRWGKITRPWNDFLEDMNNVVASVKGGTGMQTNRYDTHLELGKSNPLGTDLVFTVLAPEEVADMPRLYWRGRTYDSYENGSWVNTSFHTDPFSPITQKFNIPDTLQRTEMDFSYTVLTEEQSMLYLPPQPVWISRPADIYQNEISQERTDIVAIIAVPTLQRGEVYRAHAMLADPSIRRLQEAGEIYPTWVIKKYLQLPDDFSQKLSTLAQELSAGLKTPYDKANAISKYLRKEIKYSPSISIPPDTADPLEYVILDLKQGFCTYYASAEVLMLRSVGVPARLAVGFAQGESTVDGSRNGTIKYLIRQRDAHAWPEVYFPTYGWIEFEPTGNQEVLERRPVDAVSSLPPDMRTQQLNSNRRGPLTKRDEETEGFRTDTVTASKSVNPFLLAAIVVTVLMIGGWYTERKYSLTKQLPSYISQVYLRNHTQPPQWINNWAQWTELSSIERSFQAINISLGWLDASQPPHATSRQRAEKLRELLPDAKDAIEALEAEHRAELFTTAHGKPTPARRASIVILSQAIRRRIMRLLGYN